MNNEDAISRAVKAYRAYDAAYPEHGSTVVFAENRGKAKAVASESDNFDGCDYINIRVQRFKEADKLYKGQSEIDWYDDDTRIFMVRDMGWTCLETSLECDGCAAKAFCGHFEGDDDL